MGKGFFRHLPSFCFAEKRLFGWIFSDENDDVVKKLGCALNDVYVPIRNWVKGPRVECSSHCLYHASTTIGGGFPRRGVHCGAAIRLVRGQQFPSG